MLPLPSSLWRSPLVLTILARSSLAVIENRIIDDTRGDSVTNNQVVYQGAWNANACPQCLIQPDPGQAFDGTWTSTTYFQQNQDPVNATLTFTGTAIWVFFILANNAGTGVVTKTAANITLDNQPPVLYESTPNPSSTDLQYNVSVFSKTGLENVHHSVMISVSGIQEEVYINFDYAIYTHEDQVLGGSVESVPSPTKQVQTPTSSQPGNLSLAPTSRVAPVSRTLSAPPKVTSRSRVPSTAASISTPQVSITPVLTASEPPIFSNSAHSTEPTSGETPVEPVQTSGTQLNSQHAKPKIQTGVIIGSCLGGLAILLSLICGITFTWRMRRQRRSDRMSTVNLLDGNRGSRIHAGNGNIDENGINMSITPFNLGPLYLSQSTGLKQPEAAAMTSLGGTLSATIMPQMTRTMGENEVTRAHSRRSAEDLRRARQGELEKRLQSVQQEMREVINEIGNRRSSWQPVLRPFSTLGQPGQVLDLLDRSQRGSQITDEQISVEELQSTLCHMRQQIEHLQQQQQSAWGQGLSDESPPGYTPDTSL